MSLNGVTSNYQAYETNTVSGSDKKVSTKEISKTTAYSGVAATYEHASQSEGLVAAVNKKASNASIVAQLKADQETRMAQMQSLVTKMFSKQGITIGTADDMWKALAGGNFTADADTIAQAKEDISENGYWGVKQTSERIFSFAQALAGDDEEKMTKMKEAFEGFDDLILCPVSNWVGERAAQSPVLRQYPICTVLNGIDTDVFHYREKEALVLREKLNVGERKMILHVTASYTNPVKGGKFITELSQRLDSEKYVVVVVDGLNNPPPKEFCGIYYGRANGQEELAAFYSAADVMVLTSYRECLPTTCLESLCCGTEIVSFYFHGDEGEGSFPEKYVHFIPHGDMEQLTDTVKNVSEHHEEKKICCEAGRKIFSQKVMVENYEKIYKKLLEQSTD